MIRHVGAESLAGRMEVLTLWPFSQGEIDGVREGFIDAVFSQRLSRFEPTETRADSVARALRGGYPEVVARKASRKFGSVKIPLSASWSSVAGQGAIAFRI